MAKTSVSKLFLWVSLLLGLPLIFLNPPFQVPDEQFHFYRAYQISEGRLISIKRDSDTGDILPTSLANIAGNFLYGITGNLQGRLDSQRWAQGFKIKLKKSQRTFLSFTNPALYFPVAYIPSSLAVFVGRVFNFPPLIIFYLGRIANFLAGVGIIYLALNLVPVWKWMLLIWALIPVNIFLRASLSPDGILNAVSLLYLALILHWATSTNKKKKYKLILFLSAALISAFKQVYFPFLFILFLIPWSHLKKKSALIFWSGTLVGALSLSLLWSWIIRPIYSSMVVGNDASSQVEVFLKYPFGVLNLVSTNLIEHWPNYLRTMVGVLGWIDAYMPHWVALIYLLGMTAVGLLEFSPKLIVPPLKKIILVFLFFACVYAIGLGIYITGMPVGIQALFGIQGRYFLTPFLLLLFLLPTKFFYDPKIQEKALPFLFIFLLLISHGGMIYTFLVRYYLPE